MLNALDRAEKDTSYEIIWNFVPQEEYSATREAGLVQGAVLTVCEVFRDYAVVRINGKKLVIDSEAAERVKLSSPLPAVS